MINNLESDLRETCENVSKSGFVCAEKSHDEINL